MRCAGCSRPLFMPPPTAPIRDVASLTDLYNASSDSNDVSSTAVNNNDNNTVINIRNNSKINTNNITTNNKNNNNVSDTNNNNTNNDNNNSSDNRNKNDNNNNNENSPNNLQSNTHDKPIYVNHKSDAMGKIWGAVESVPGSSSLVVYLSKLAYHTACYEKIKDKK